MNRNFLTCLESALHPAICRGKIVAATPYLFVSQNGTNRALTDYPPTPTAALSSLPSQTSAPTHRNETNRIPGDRTSTNPKTKKNGSSYKGRSLGDQTYLLADINALLDTVESVEPFGANYWAAVAPKYNDYVREDNQAERDGEGLRIKFD